MTIPVHLPSKEFKNKKEATQFFSEMLNRYNKGVDISAEDSGYLSEILEYHPNSQEKKGQGVKRFYKDDSPAPNSNSTECFYIERTDGTVTDFSVNKCIGNVKKP